MQNLATKNPLRLPRSAFSLVEVTIAVSIVSLALITYIGLLPQGLEMSQKTSETNLASSILESIVRDLESATWASLIPGTTRTYYSDQGVEVTAEQTDRIQCVAEIEITPTAFLPADAALQPFLRRVLIRIKPTPNPSFAFSAGNQDQYLTFCHLIARSR
jgi:uncharacterized protein (TIGR02598 family)